MQQYQISERHACTDGSVWGDRDRAEHVQRLRTQLWDKLKSLANVYQEKGQEAFLDKLHEASDLAVIQNFQRMYAEDPQNTKQILDKLNGMLHYADLHQRGIDLRNASTASSR